MHFSEKLILLRKRKGMTQQEFSRAVGVSRQSVYKWESGQSYPEATKLLEIRRLYGVSIDHLLDESVGLPFPTTEENNEIIKETKEILKPTPTMEKENPEPADLPDQTASAKAEEPVLRASEVKKPEISTQSPRPVSTSVLVQKRKKKPNTLKEIVGVLFGKKR